MPWPQGKPFLTVSLTSISAVVLAAALTLHAQQAPTATREHTFRGRVEKVDVAAGTFIVNGDNVQGWMAAMTMTYRAQPPDVLREIKPGDVITATVYDGNFSTLFNVRVDRAASAAAAAELPPVTYVCPSPGEESFLDDKPGICPGSKAPLVPVRIVTAYSCLRNPAFILERPGRCPTDRTELVPITTSMYFSCSRFPGVREMDPGTCPDGSARVKTFERRAHGDHNPRHGGSVYMSENQWVHIEGTFVEPSIFRVYVYDEMTRPMAVSGMAARAIMADSAGREVGAFIPLAPGKSADQSTMEARLPSTAFPFNMRLYMIFRSTDREQVFDFTFNSYSKEP